MQAEAAAADTFIQLHPGAVEQRDAGVDFLAQRSADGLPVVHRRSAALRQLGQLLFDLGEAQSELLRDQDKAQPADVAAQEAALVAAGAQRLDQALVLLITDRRNREPGAPRQFADREQIVAVHRASPSENA